MAKLSELRTDASNANRGTERGRYALETSLRKYGAGRSILIDREGRIIAGNKTAVTAGEIGLDDVIIVQTDGTKLVAVQRTDLDLDDKAARELAYADNRTGQLDLDFDPEQMLADLNAGIDLSAFWRQDELDELLADLLPKPELDDPGAQIDRAEELRVKWQTATGQMWQMGEHRLICGDCTDAAVVARVMAGEKAALVVTDPPYGIGADKKNAHSSIRDSSSWADVEWDKKPELSHMAWIANFADSVAIWGGNYFTDALPVSSGWLAWIKPQYGTGFSLSDMELCWTNQNIGPRCKEFGRRDGHDHPTQKPVDLIIWTIERMDRKGDGPVVDFYCGSGTTLIACEQLGRKCRAVEISAAYTAVCLERYHGATGVLPVLVEG